MSLILSGTDGLSDVDGSAGTPAIRGTDTNTGIFFPAADTIAFSEGGVEAMRIDSSGQVGIGTSSPFGKLDVVGTAYVSSASSNPQQIAFFANGTASYVSSTYQGSGSYKPLAFEVGGSERMRIDSSGNVAIGTTTFNQKLTIGGINANNNTNQNSIEFQDTNANPLFRLTGGRGANGNEGYGVFSTLTGGTMTERMRIDSAGAIACTAVTTNGPYLRAGNTISLANNATITITNSRAGGALICIYETGNGLGGVFWANYSTAVTKIAGDGSATDAGANFAVYKSINDHTTTFKNRSGGTSTYTIAVYSAFAVN
jgi:hypothetical protein